MKQYFLILFLIIIPIFKVFGEENKSCPYCIPKGSLLACEEIKEAMNFINNKIRAEVNVPPLKWDCKVAKLAQKKTDYMAKTGDFRHHLTFGYGENKYWGIMHNSLLDAVKHWYKEKKDFVYGALLWCKPNKRCGHYTQLIWKTTKKIGCGKSKGKDGKYYIVCNFYPMGNIIGMQPY